MHLFDLHHLDPTLNTALHPKTILLSFNPGLTGRLAELQRFPRLATLGLTQTGIVGELGELGPLESLVNLTVGSQGIGGDVAVFKWLRLLESVYGRAPPPPRTN